MPGWSTGPDPSVTFRASISSPLSSQSRGSPANMLRAGSPRWRAGRACAGRCRAVPARSQSVLALARRVDQAAARRVSVESGSTGDHSRWSRGRSERGHREAAGAKSAPICAKRTKFAKVADSQMLVPQRIFRTRRTNLHEKYDNPGCDISTWAEIRHLNLALTDSSLYDCFRPFATLNRQKGSARSRRWRSRN